MCQEEQGAGGAKTLSWSRVEWHPLDGTLTLWPVTEQGGVIATHIALAVRADSRGIPPDVGEQVRRRRDGALHRDRHAQAADAVQLQAGAHNVTCLANRQGQSRSAVQRPVSEPSRGRNDLWGTTWPANRFHGIGEVEFVKLMT